MGMRGSRGGGQGGMRTYMHTVILGCAMTWAVMGSGEVWAGVVGK